MDFDKNYFLSNKGGNQDERIFIEDVTPGTYYAVVYSFEDQTWDNSNGYSLSFEQVQKDDNTTYYDISEGRKAGDLCAIWTSSYKPLGYTPTTISNSDAKVYYKNNSTYPFISSLYSHYQDKDMMYAKLYIWDLTLRATIYSIVSKLMKSLETDFEKYKELSNVSAELTDVGFALSANGLIINILQFEELAIV